MYNGTSGSMYEEIEQNRLRKERHAKIMLRRTIVIIVSLIIILYLALIFIDTRRFKNGDNPLITLSVQTKDYDDGHVVTHVSLGWVFRYYNRETITDSEMVPFWKPIKKDNVLKRENDPTLPEPEKDYKIPSNSMNQEKVDNVLFFFDSEENNLGTYACLLSEHDCEISISDELDDDPKYGPRTKMGIIDNRYVFITEYKNKNTDAEEKHVFLYDLVAKNYIAQYEGIRYTTIGNDNKGYIDSSKYIIKKNGKWGLDQVIKGQVTNILDYKYLYIKYSNNTNLYILKTDSNKWLTYDANKKIFTTEIAYKIEDLYIVKEKTYVSTYEDTYEGKKNYKLFNSDGENVLNKDNIDDLVAYDNFLTYTNENKLYLIDYDGNELISGLPLYFPKYSETTKIKQYSIATKGKFLVITISKGTTPTHFVDEYYYNIDDLTLSNTRKDVQVTVKY